MDKIIVNIFRAMVIEFGLIAGLYCWNWLGSNLLPDYLKVFLVFQNAQDVFITEATKRFNIIGVIIVCFLRGWLYYYAHLVSYGILSDNCYKPMNFSKGKAFLCNIIFAIIVILGVAIVGFPDDGQCFLVVYFASLALALIGLQISYNKEVTESEARQKKFEKEFLEEWRKDTTYRKEMQERARKDMEILSSMFYEDSSQNEITHNDNKQNNKPLNDLVAASKYFHTPKKDNKTTIKPKTPGYGLNNLIARARIFGLHSLSHWEQLSILEKAPEEYKKLKEESFHK